MLPALLVLGAALWLGSGDMHAVASDLSEQQPHIHPLAADMNQLAGEVCNVTICLFIPQIRVWVRL